jgi:hypothetical protein
MKLQPGTVKTGDKILLDKLLMIMMLSVPRRVASEDET